MRIKLNRKRAISAMTLVLKKIEIERERRCEEAIQHELNTRWFPAKNLQQAKGRAMERNMGLYWSIQCVDYNYRKYNHVREMLDAALASEQLQVEFTHEDFERFETEWKETKK